MINCSFLLVTLCFLSLQGQLHKWMSTPLYPSALSRSGAKMLLFGLMIVSLNLYGQEGGKTKIIYSGNVWQFNKDIYPDGPRLIGNVVMNHDSAFLYCDSAWINETENRVIAFGNVNVKLSDTLNLYCDSLRYSGNTRIARAHENVKLIDNQTILTTDSLVYDRNTSVAQYDSWGKIVNGRNNLVSRFGYYYTERKLFFFREKVILLNPDYTMYSDTLKYNTVTEVAYFYGPSHILSRDKKDSIYTERGWYNTRLDEGSFLDHAKIYHENTYLSGDSMYYERKQESGQVFRDAVIIDTVQRIILTGDYGELQQKKEYAFITGRARAMLAEKKDTLYLHADTIRGIFDTTRTIKKVDGWNKVKFFRTNLQGMCDSLHMAMNDSSVRMYREPVLWSDSNQLTADSITLLMRNGEADSLKMFGEAFIISREDTNRYNQIKGRNVLAKFLNNELYKILVIGNAQTIYYAREENRALIGINVVVSSDMLIFLAENKVDLITFIEKPEAHTYPEKDLPESERFLKNFKWLDAARPKDKDDIFRW